MKEKVIEVQALPEITVAKHMKYLCTVKGDDILFNKMPALSQSKAEKKNQAKKDYLDVERENWREKLYYDNDGEVYVPGENIHECLKEGAQYWGEKIPGAGNKTYTDVVNSAVIVENMYLGIKKDSERIVSYGKMCNGNPSKGKKSGAKVYKIRPIIMNWQGSFILHVFDPRLTKHVLLAILTRAGTFKGLCDWRPKKGRFELVDMKEI